MYLNLYARNKNGNIVILNGHRESFRCRQRGVMSNGTKVLPLKFISYRQSIKDVTLHNKAKYGPFEYNTISKL